MDKQLTAVQTELTAWRRIHGKAHLPQPLKKKIVTLLDRFSAADLSRVCGIPTATLSVWRRQHQALAYKEETKPEPEGFLELPHQQHEAATESADSQVELFLRNGAIRAVVSMEQFQALLEQEGAA